MKNERITVQVCDHGHPPVTYYEKDCPLCAALERCALADEKLKIAQREADRLREAYSLADRQPTGELTNDPLNERIDQLEQRMNNCSLGTRVDNLGESLNHTSQKVAGLQTRLDKLEQRVISLGMQSRG